MTSGTIDFLEINGDGKTALIFAVRHGVLEIVQTLLSFIEDDRLAVLTARDRNLNDALSIAIDQNSTEIAELLRQAIDAEINRRHRGRRAPFAPPSPLSLFNTSFISSEEELPFGPNPNLIAAVRNTPSTLPFQTSTSLNGFPARVQIEIRHSLGSDERADSSPASNAGDQFIKEFSVIAPSEHPDNLPPQ